MMDNILERIEAGDRLREQNKTVKSDEGGYILAQEIMAIYRMRKLDDIQKYIAIVSKAKEYLEKLEGKRNARNQIQRVQPKNK